jgi:predicted MPP superfamily phosphohydrolase
MPDNIVLRFSDFETETVLIHRRIINSRGAVWWAWWKKESENHKAEDLAALNARCPATIGLINRQRGNRFFAKCVGVVFSADGSPIPSPDPASTPDYYRDDSFPAWFQLSEIYPVDASEWDEVFGGVPLGEATLFVLQEQDPERAPQLREEQFAVVPVAARSPYILHLSDLHFGSDFGFPVTSRTVPTLQQSLEEAITLGLDHIDCPPIGVVVVSGDITTRGEPDGFTAARVFLERLLGKLGLGPEHVVVVPGNHDILLDDTVTRSYDAQQPFRDMVSLLTGKKEPEMNRIHWFTTSSGPDLLILALNSVRPRARTTMEYGYVGRDLYGPLVEEMRQIRASINARSGVDPLTMAVLHHHVLPTALMEDPEEGRPVSLTLDAGQLIEDLQRAGFHAILHGHQHVPFVGSTSRAFENHNGTWVRGPNVHVIGGGSCSVRPERLWNQMRNNSMGIYHAAGNMLDVAMYQFAPGVDFKRYLALDLPLT